MRSICNKIIHAQTISVRAIIWPKTSGIRMIWRTESIRKIKDSIDEGGIQSLHSVEERLCVIKKNGILKIVKNYRIPFKAIKKRRRAYVEHFLGMQRVL